MAPKAKAKPETTAKAKRAPKTAAGKTTQSASGTKAAAAKAKKTKSAAKPKEAKAAKSSAKAGKTKTAAKTTKAKAKKSTIEVVAVEPVLDETVLDPIGDTTDGEGGVYLGDGGLGEETADEAEAPEQWTEAEEPAEAADDASEPQDEEEEARPQAPLRLERLQKILSQAGIASRRHAEEMIAEGRVMVNGQVVTTPGSKADPTRDHIRVDGKLLHGAERHRYYMLNKPKGFVTTVSDPEGRPTVMQFVEKAKERLYPVGRLDYQSEGLLLMTNDGTLANLLTKAGSGVEKTYLVKVAGQPTEQELDKLRAGVDIERGGEGSGRVRTAPARVRQVREGDNPWFEVVLIEGRNRELRKMFAAVGHFVEKIRRVGYGPLVLDVEPGKLRELTPDEVVALQLTAEGKIKPKRAKINRLLPKDAGTLTETRGERAGKSGFRKEGFRSRSSTSRPGAPGFRSQGSPGGAERPRAPRFGGDRRDRGGRPDRGGNWQRRDERPPFRREREQSQTGSGLQIDRVGETGGAQGEPQRSEFRGSRPPRSDRPSGSRFGGARPAGQRPFENRENRSQRGEWKPRGGEFRPRDERRRFEGGDRPERGERIRERKPFTSREDGGQREERGPRREFGGGKRPFGGGGRGFAGREGGGRGDRPFRKDGPPKFDGERKFGGERKSFGRGREGQGREGQRPFAGKPRFEKPGFGEPGEGRRPFGGKPRFDRPKFGGARRDEGAQSRFGDKPRREFGGARSEGGERREPRQPAGEFRGQGKRFGGGRPGFGGGRKPGFGGKPGGGFRGGSGRGGGRPGGPKRG